MTQLIGRLITPYPTTTVWKDSIVPEDQYGKQNPKDTGQPDRPSRIEPPREPQGSGDDGAPVDGQSDS